MKYSAFGTVLKSGNGSVQIETATVVGTIGAAGGGNATVIITAAGLVGTPLTVTVAVANSDTAALVGGKIRAALSATSAVTDMFGVSGSSAAVVLTRLIPMQTDATLNISINNGTSTGLTPALTSTDTNPGETLTTVANVSNISGPGLSLDTSDVTTHDSPGAFEEVVGTVVRTGEVSIDLVFDPTANTHSATSGLAKFLTNKTLVAFSITFPGNVTWSFAAYVTGFETSAPHNDALTASAKLKITGAPTLV